MTTPGVQPPEGAYVPGSRFGQEHRGLTPETAKQTLFAPMQSAFGGIPEMFLGFLSGLLGGVIQVVGGFITGLFDAVGSLFSDSRRDVAKVEAARVAGETAIVEHMRGTADKLDASIRFGGAYMSSPYWRLTDGDKVAHHVPVNTSFPVSKGTKLWAPADTTTINNGTVIGGGNDSYALVAKKSGGLELLEGGLWFIWFQSSARFYSGWGGMGDGPSRAWCYVTPAGSDLLPQGDPSGTTIQTRNAKTGEYNSATPISQFVAGYGRATHFAGVDSPDGGYTVSGMLPVSLPSGGYKVTLSTQNDWHYGGPASTYIVAMKVNTADLGRDIESLKAAIGTALPATPITQELTEAKIAKLVADAKKELNFEL